MVKNDIEKGDYMNKIIFIAKGWGRTAGGINAFNYSLCKAMAGMYGENIVCVVPDVDNKICSRAKEKYGIKLVGMISGDFEDAGEIVKRLYNDGIIKPESKKQKIIWIGHDIYTGQTAVSCRDIVKGSKCAVIHHMAYNEYYSILNDDAASSIKKEREQRKILSAADYIFPNGPKLKNSAMNLVGRAGQKKILEILPGIEKGHDFFNDAHTFSVVTFGRVEEESGSKKSNSIIKQTNLAIAAWASFVGDMDETYSTNMDVIGYDKTGDINDENKKIKSFAEKYGGKTLTIRALPYMDDSDLLFDQIGKSSLYMMLSREEGFGLSCLEAISTGIPVILSENTGLYEALKERKLDNYLLTVKIDGSNEEPYFTENDFENVKKKIHEFYYNKERYKKDILALREELEKKGFSWEESAASMIKFMEIKMERAAKKTLRKTQILPCREKFVDEKWFDRLELYSEMDLKYEEQRIILVQGSRYSKKELSMLWWAKYKGIAWEQLYYYDALEKKSPGDFRLQAEELLELNDLLAVEVYFLISGFPVNEPGEYYKALRQMLENYPKLHFIIFTDKEFSNLSKITVHCTWMRLTIRGMSKESVRDYFELYGIDITEEEIQELEPTEYLPEILKDYVDYVLDKESDVKEALRNVEIDKNIPQEISDRLDRQEVMLAGVLALFEAPFSKNMANKMAERRGIHKKIIDGLVKNRIIFKYSKHSYKIPQFYRKCLMEKLTDEEIRDACSEISRYYYSSYKYAWGEKLTNEDVMRGINACRFAIKAHDYEKARNYLMEGKYALQKRGKRKGMYKFLIPIMKDLYHIFGDSDVWLVYHLVHCLVITGDISYADRILRRMDMGTIVDWECKVAVLRLKGELYCEYNGPEKAYEYLYNVYNACRNPAKTYHAIDEQMRAYLLELQIECGLYKDVLDDCEKYMKNHKSDYLNAILLNYAAICKRKLKVEQRAEDFDEVIELFENLDDKRGIAWTKMEKGIALKEMNAQGAEDTLIEAIEAQKESGECSRQYRLHLAELCKHNASEKLGHLLEGERERFRRIMKERFIPKELLTYQYS